MPFKYHISFATDLAANFGCNRFRIMPDIVSTGKLLRAAIWSSCAVLLESEQHPFQVSQTGRRFRPAALHRIRYGTWGIVPISHFYSETNDWLQDWAKQWALLWSPTTPSKISFHMRNKTHLHWAKYTNHWTFQAVLSDCRFKSALQVG